MLSSFKIKFVPHNKQKSNYDWVDIEVKKKRVGKARCLKRREKFFIFSIMIYPEYQGNGYGRKFVEIIKDQYDEIIADRVRSTAIEFWEKLDFVKDKDGVNWVYKV